MTDRPEPATPEAGRAARTAAAPETNTAALATDPPAAPESEAEEVRVELVDDEGRSIGTLGKLAAHQAPGRLHRAFSAFLFDDRGRVLLQKRAAVKYHFGGRWSNACCGHPAPGASVVPEAERRLGHELGVAVQLESVGSFRYAATDPASGLVEHEDDTVLVGYVAADLALAPAPDEVSAVEFVEPSELRRRLAASPGEFTPWLGEALACLTAAGHPHLFSRR